MLLFKEGSESILRRWCWLSEKKLVLKLKCCWCSERKIRIATARTCVSHTFQLNLFLTSDNRDLNYLLWKCWLVILSTAQKGIGHHTQQQSWAVRNLLHEIHQLMNRFSFTNPLELLSQCFPFLSSLYFLLFFLVSSFGFLCDWKLIKLWPKRKKEEKNTIVFNVWPKVTTCDRKEKAK